MVLFSTSCLASFYVLIAWYGWWHFGHAKTNRQRSYVITLLGSSVMTVCSIPILYRAMTSPEGFMTLFAPGSTWETAVIVFFTTSLACDLGVGTVFYRNKINLLTGWIHHTVYIFLLFYVIRQDLSRFFMGMCILELPTLSLSIGSVFPQYRYDYVFAAFYVPTRIGFHGFMIGYTFIIARPFVADVALGLVVFFPLHCYWFYGFILQQKRLNGDKSVIFPAPVTNMLQPVISANQVSKEHIPAAVPMVSHLKSGRRRGTSHPVYTTLNHPIDSALQPILAH